MRNDKKKIAYKIFQYAADKTRKNSYIACKENSKNNVNERNERTICMFVCTHRYFCLFMYVRMRTYVKAKVKNVSYV